MQYLSPDLVNRQIGLSSSCQVITRILKYNKKTIVTLYNLYLVIERVDLVLPPRKIITSISPSEPKIREATEVGRVPAEAAAAPAAAALPVPGRTAVAVAAVRRRAAPTVPTPPDAAA